MKTTKKMTTGEPSSSFSHSLWVEANTGIACVLPAWYILETLNDVELMKARRENDKRIAKAQQI
jgi:hypothetical protein